jgi:hypothetical protein
MPKTAKAPKPKLTKEVLDVLKQPCLVLEWRYVGIDSSIKKALSRMPADHPVRKFNEENPSHEWYCEYYLNMPVHPGDIRLDNLPKSEQKLCRIKIGMNGGTKVTCNKLTMIRDDGSIDTPFRDGVHILMDSVMLNNLPMYAISEGKVEKLSQPAPRAPEVK